MRTVIRTSIVVINLALVVLLFYFLTSLGGIKRNDWRQFFDFKPAACTVLNKNVMPSIDGSSEEPQINVKYVIGKTENHATANEYLLTKTYSQDQAEQFVNQYLVGKTYRCWYEEGKLNTVYLNKGNWKWPKTAKIFAGIVVLILVRKVLKTRV